MYVASHQPEQWKRVKGESKIGDSGPDPVWQKRFYDFNVWSERKRIEKLRYTHRNPVKRGLVEELDQWKWSSFRSYFYGERGVVRVNYQLPGDQGSSGRELWRRNVFGLPTLSPSTRMNGAPRAPGKS